MNIFLMLPGSPIPDWLLLLSPLVAIVIVAKSTQWVYHWYQRKFTHHHEHVSEGDSEMNG